MTTNIKADEKTIEAANPRVLTEETFATLDDLFGKPKRTQTITLSVPNADGTIERKLKLQLEAISSNEYDELIALHPPKRKDKENGAAFNTETFAPALIAACVKKPAMTLDQATRLYQSQAWSGGEIGGIFFAAQKLCNAGLDVPFNDGD